MARPVQISVIGKGADDEALGPLAEEVGRRLAEAGAVVICGGLGGVMEWVARGASEAGGEVTGIVPGTDVRDANPYCTHVVATGIGWARNLAVVASGDAVIAVGGEWGTLSEIAHAREVGRPVVAIRSWAVTPGSPMEEDPGIEAADDPATAVERALALAAAAR